MRIEWRGITAAITLLLLALGNASAQDAPRGLSLVREGGRAGFWGGFSLGAGGEAFDLRDGAGYSEELYRPTVSLRVGGTVNPNLRLGGEVLAWINERGNNTESLSSLLFVGQLYPVATTGFYLKGGLGLGRNAVDFHEGIDAVADLQDVLGQGACWKLDGRGREQRAGHPPRAQAADDLLHDPRRINERDVDRKPHPEGVHRVAPGDDERRIRRHAVAPEEPAAALGAGHRELDGLRDRRLGAGVHQHQWTSSRFCFCFGFGVISPVIVAGVSSSTK